MRSPSTILALDITKTLPNEVITKTTMLTFRFLVHDIPPDDLADKAPVEEEPPSITDGSEYPTLATIAAEAPYRLPARLIYKRLSALVIAQRDGAAHHIRSLRADPGSFSDVLKEWALHRQENLLDTKRQGHPVLDTPLFWERVIGNMLLDAYGALITWDIVAEQLAKLTALQLKYSDVITPHQPLPAEYMKALLTLRYYLSQAQTGQIALLKTGFPASPAFRSVFVREPHIPGSSMIRLQSRGETDPLMWHITQLWTEQQCDLLGLPGLMDEIERLIESDPKEKGRISAWIAKVFADIGLIARIRHELDIYQPWAAGFNNAYVDHRDAIGKDFPRVFATFAEIYSKLIEVQFAELGSPINSRFTYPSDKRRSQTTTETMQKAESDLEKFWTYVDKSHRRKTGKTLGEAVKYIMKDPFRLERTPDWVDAPKQPMASKDSMIKGKDALPESLSALHLDSADIPSKFVLAETKIKPKTCGSAHEESSSIPDTPPTPQAEEDAKPTFVLKNRAFKVFKTLFFNPAQSDLPGDIPWAEFLFAMRVTGLAPEKMYGSVWQFTPTSLDVERSIQFHEPHPASKIPFSNARRIGRRLARAYGWEGGCLRWIRGIVPW